MLATSKTSAGIGVYAIAQLLYLWNRSISTPTTVTHTNSTPPIDKGRVLFFPVTLANSHVTHHYRLAEELSDDGYKVDILRYNMVSFDEHTPKPPPNVTLYSFDSGCDYTWLKPYYHQISWATGWWEILIYYAFPWIMLKHGTEMCDKMAPEMIDILKANHYDAIIVDTTYIPCSWMVTNQLKVPYAILMGAPMNVFERQSLHAMHTPYATFPNYMQHLTDIMNLQERIKSIWNAITLSGIFYYDVCMVLVSWIHKWEHTQLTPSMTFHNGHLLIDGVAPTTFASMHVNSLTHGPQYQRKTYAKARVNEYVQRICNDGGKGVVIFSLSTMLSSLTVAPDNIKLPLIRAFTDSPLSNYSLIYRRFNKNDHLLTNATNIVQVDWVDMRYLMSSCNVRAMITQGGMNSVIESVYAAIPVIGIPLMVDQPANMANMQQRGLGYTVRKDTLHEVDSLQIALTQVLTNETYATTSLRYSKMVHETGADHNTQTSFWLKWFVRHAPHIDKYTRSENYDTTQQHVYHLNLDVLAVFVSMCLCVILVCG